MARLGFELSVCAKVSIEWGRFEECFGRASVRSPYPALFACFLGPFKGPASITFKGEGREVKWASKWSLFVGG